MSTAVPPPPPPPNTQQSPPPLPAQTSSQTQPGSRELLPLTDAQRKAIRKERISLLAYLIGIPIFTVVAVILPLLTVHTVSGFALSIILIPIAVVVVNLLWLLAFLWSQVASRRDLHEGTFTRWDGPIAVTQEESTTQNGKKVVKYHLAAGGKRFSLRGDDGPRLAALNLTSGSVDYATHSDDLLEVRGPDGAVLYRDKNLSLG